MVSVSSKKRGVLDAKKNNSTKEEEGEEGEEGEIGAFYPGTHGARLVQSMELCRRSSDRLERSRT